MDGVYKYEYETFDVTPQMLEDYKRLGYIIVRDLLDKEELGLLYKALEETDDITKHGFQIDDGKNRKSKLALWSHPGNDLTGIIARSEKCARTCEKLAGGEVYHYHTKLMMKEARTGGEHVWHQDYGYWYKNGCLFPDQMITIFIAYDRTNKENGCLQILPGSHKCGRIEHLMVGGQTGADLERLEHLKQKIPLQYVELEPGDALFFHSNLLHRSEQNNSDHRRWAFLVAYNRKTNNPVYVHHHPQYTPLDIVPNSAIKSCTNFHDTSGKEFMDPTTDKTIMVEKEDEPAK